MTSGDSAPTAHFEAEIFAIPTEEGGRKTGMLSGYRPTHDFGLEGTLNDAQHDYEHGELLPGETTRALLTLSMPEFQRGRLYEGMEFTVREGSRIVARGRILKVFDEQLLKRGA